MPTFDPRITPVRDDLAAEHLKDTVKRKKYVRSTSHRIIVPTVSVRKTPDIQSGIDTQFVYGSRFNVYEEKNGWAWGQEVVKSGEGYVGFVTQASLGKLDNSDKLNPTHRINVLRAPLFLSADLKSPVQILLPLNAKICITEHIGNYAVADGLGYVHIRHITPLSKSGGDFVTFAEQHLGLPYIWGGISSDGLDCSGLVLSSIRAVGLDAPRDTDMQEAKLGAELSQDATLKRGDLVFWKGHVGILQDSKTLLHANAHHMLAASEPLAQAVKRIAKTAGPVTSIRRL